MGHRYYDLNKKKVDILDFRPIGLVHSFPKLLVKLLAEHLVPRLPELISINQGAFVKGHSIQDYFFLVQKTMKLQH